MSLPEEPHGSPEFGCAIRKKGLVEKAYYRFPESPITPKFEVTEVNQRGGTYAESCSLASIASNKV
jgi:hypothetical protein